MDQNFNMMNCFLVTDLETKKKILLPQSTDYIVKPLRDKEGYKIYSSRMPISLEIVETSEEVYELFKYGDTE